MYMSVNPRIPRQGYLYYNPRISIHFHSIPDEGHLARNVGHFGQNLKEKSDFFRANLSLHR